jgi:antitoxin component YwqK of YwqJK toxin-antitoxin module
VKPRKRRIKAGDVFKRLKIPSNAKKTVIQRWDDGSPLSIEYRIKGEVVAVLFWHEDGSLMDEEPYHQGKRHGMYRTWAPSGQIMWECRCVNGKEHGIARQWSSDGRLLGLYKMVHGTGHDLWFDDDGSLSEEYNRRDGGLHGIERWWDHGKLYIERYWRNNQLHGIWREWIKYPRLSRGYPQYYVNGKKVTKRAYIKACQTDPSLPPFKESENKPHRKDRPGESFWDPDAHEESEKKCI